MVIFSGKASGKDFYDIEAKDGFDLCQKLFPDCDRKDVPTLFRMWIEVVGAATNKPFWCDACLCCGSNTFFDFSMQQITHTGTVKVIIRGADEPSPNTSPHGKTDNEQQTPAKRVPPSPKNDAVLTVMSNLTEATELIDLDLAPSNSFEKYQAVNEIEPFTLVDIAATSEETSELNLIPLSFPKIQKRRVVQTDSVVLVDLDSFEKFVETEISKGKSPLDLCLSQVRCRGGKTKDFRLTAHVWMGSILPQSRGFRFLFTAAAYGESCRTAQLKELKNEAPGLYDRLLFWIDDMLNFEEAEWRLEVRIEATGVPSFMSPFYFTEPEARYLGDIYVEGSTRNLKDTLDALAKVQEEVCTKSDLVPLMERTFKVKKGFQKNSEYKEKRAVWLKQTLHLHALDDSTPPAVSKPRFS